jgi:glycosyltransferase involved in cell wall biosynthesis
VNSKLNKLVLDQRILFVDGIRPDQMSGGRTSTKNILHVLSFNNDFIYFSTSPTGGMINRLLYSVVIFPANLFALLKIFHPNIWGEFLLRLSPVICINFLIKYVWWKPSIIIFNHHSTFYLSRFVRPKKTIYIWHDVPSLKKTSLNFRSGRFNQKACAIIQKFFLYTKGSEHFVFSFTDRKFLRRFYGIHSFLLPIFLGSPPEVDRKMHPNSWLLVGTWGRIENRDGAEILFREYCTLVAKSSSNPAKFNVAGFGADRFMRDLLVRYPNELKCLKYSVTSEYSQLGNFQDLALLAPVLSGAGIKVKTIEAWSFGIPVIGTSQAFSGIPASIWKLGGMRVKSLAEMAAICFDQVRVPGQIIQLRPQKAFMAYQSAIKD